MAESAGEKTVLVQFETSYGLRNRPVTFSGGKEELLLATKLTFSDVLSNSGEIYFQIQDDSWGAGFFVDLQNQEIPSRAILKAVQKQVGKKQNVVYVYDSSYFLNKHLCYPCH